MKAMLLSIYVSQYNKDERECVVSCKFSERNERVEREKAKERILGQRHPSIRQTPVLLIDKDDDKKKGK